MTTTEKILNRLSKKTFLSFWSYSNLYTDEGRKCGVGDGKELCDHLVVFKDSIIIFSVKSIKFNSAKTLEVAWRRWYKKAIASSAKQNFGAKKWIKEFPERIFLDKKCQHQIPINLSRIKEENIHLVCVAIGSEKSVLIKKRKTMA